MAFCNIQFVKADPCGNTTVLVLTPLPRDLYTATARQLMQENTLYAEQVGFVEKTATGSCLHMMGGEFCGNASRCYAAWLLMGGQEYVSQGGELLRPLAEEGGSIVVRISGQTQPLPAAIEYTGSPYSCFAEIAMPYPQTICHGCDALLGQYSLVAFNGISHGILWQQTANDALMPRLRQLLSEHELDDSCCGMMLVEQQQPLFMRPLVYVSGVDSLVWEHSCGSGSLALLCALADKQKQGYTRLPVHQPGGVLLPSVGYSSEGIRQTSLAGQICFTAWGTAQVEL